MRMLKSRVALALVCTGVLLTCWSFAQLNTAVADEAVKPATGPSAGEQALIREIQCVGHLLEIYTGLAVYANDHTEQYPPDLGTLLVTQKMDMSTFICPAANSALPDQYKKMAPAQQAAWINLHTDYVYLGAKSSALKFKSDAPLVYEKDDDHSGLGVTVLFGDGHFEFLKLDDLHHRLGAKAGTERTTSRVERAAGQPPAIPLITRDEAKAILARAEISKLKTAVLGFEIDNGRFPTTKEGLEALVEKPGGELPNWHAYIGTLRKDPWGHPYIYACPGTNKEDFDLFSPGPDGKPGTADDLK